MTLYSASDPSIAEKMSHGHNDPMGRSLKNHRWDGLLSPSCSESNRLLGFESRE
ncbi:hypothetical protein P692DRAFT_20837693 [Suillus brevipes Sb2]|nr:hypothetical protein P692DRAFT_20837693 [Suillus brevipes Sb2]